MSRTTATGGRALPDGWNVKTLGEVSWFQEGPGVRNWQFTSTGVKLLNGTNIFRGRLDLSSTTRFISAKEAAGAYAHFLADPGDIVIASSGITIDRLHEKVAFVEQDDLPVCMNTSTIRFKVRAGLLESSFLFQFLVSDGFKSQIGGQATGSAQLNFGPSHVGKVLLPVPPLFEQQAIAAALTDADALLAGLDRLIAKKRDLKQAAMQQLLTGQTRLPGFRGEWSTATLSLLCAMKSGEGITSEDIDDFSPYPCFGGNGLRGYTSRFTHEGHFALIGRQGALCGNVTFAAGKFFASEHAVVVTPNRSADIRWLTNVLATMNLNRYSESSAQPGLSVSKVLMLEIRVPPTVEEQTAIATVLSDMDAELAALEARRDKTRALKQGMMQELLTGRTRLV